jgi:hypothetical protein
MLKQEEQKSKDLDKELSIAKEERKENAKLTNYVLSAIETCIAISRFQAIPRAFQIEANGKELRCRNHWYRGHVQESSEQSEQVR